MARDFRRITAWQKSDDLYYLHLARRLDYLSAATYDECFLMKEEAARTLQGLINAVMAEV